MQRQRGELVPIIVDHFPPVERVADVSDAERIEDLSDLSDEQLDRMREVRDEARRKNEFGGNR